MKKWIILLLCLSLRQTATSAEVVENAYYYCFTNGVSNAQVNVDFGLENPGDGVRFSFWNVQGLDQPSISDLPDSTGWTNRPLAYVWPPVYVVEAYRVDALEGGMHSSGRGVFDGVDIEATEPNTGMILTDTNFYRWLIWVDELGVVQATQVSASPEVAFTTRVARINAQRIGVKDLKQDIRDLKVSMTNGIASADQNITDAQAIVALTNGFTAAESRSMVNAIRGELIDTDREVKDLWQEMNKLRRIVGNVLKEAESK
jgi:hypothetical protein